MKAACFIQPPFRQIISRTAYILTQFPCNNRNKKVKINTASLTYLKSVVLPWEGDKNDEFFNAEKVYDPWVKVSNIGNMSKPFVSGG